MGEPIIKKFEKDLLAIDQFYAEFDKAIREKMSFQEIEELAKKVDHLNSRLNRSFQEAQKEIKNLRGRTKTCCCGSIATTKYRSLKSLATGIGWIGSIGGYALTLFEPLTVAGCVIGSIAATGLCLDGFSDKFQLDPSDDIKRSEALATLSVAQFEHGLKLQALLQKINRVYTTQKLIAENEETPAAIRHLLIVEKGEINEKLPLKQKENKNCFDESSSSFSSPLEPLPETLEEIKKYSHDLLNLEFSSCHQSYEELPTAYKNQELFDKLLSTFLENCPKEHALKKLLDAATELVNQKIEAQGPLLSSHDSLGDSGSSSVTTEETFSPRIHSFDENSQKGLRSAANSSSTIAIPSAALSWGRVETGDSPEEDHSFDQQRVKFSQQIEIDMPSYLAIDKFNQTLSETFNLTTFPTIYSKGLALEGRKIMRIS